MKETAVNPLAWLGAVLGAFFASIPALTWLLVALMFVGLLFSAGADASERKLSVRTMWKEANVKLGSLGIVVVCALIQQHVNLFGIDLVMVATVFYLGPVIVGIIRDAARMGVPVPPELTGVMAYFNRDNNADRPAPKNPS